jgi:RHS repeat-associated protein
VLLEDGTRKYVWGLGSGPIYAVNGTSIEVAHADGLGSVRALTDGSGTLTQTYRTDPFGLPTATQGSSSQPFGFTGEQQDGTGLVYLRARMYDPQSGRFLQRDTVFQGAPGPQGLHRYAYAGNSPTNSTDPSGHWIDTAVDVGFILYDLYRLAADGPEHLGENLTALGLDAVGAALPFATGLGAASRASRLADHAGDVARVADEAASCAINSFSAETRVETAEGPRPIASLRAGDLVLAWEEQTGTIGLYPITAVIAHEDEHVLKLTIDAETLTTTAEHPFYVEGHGWLPAEALRAGLRVRRSDGGFGLVRALALERQPQRMYNLTVAQAHTFFVGRGQWLVHNAGCGPHGNSRATTKTAHLYLLRSMVTGDFLKWGVAHSPHTRYSRTFMGDKRMEIISSGSRADMLDLERSLVERIPGRLNREPWAGRMRERFP